MTKDVTDIFLFSFLIESMNNIYVHPSDS